MPLDNSKLKKVYATLQQGGYKQDYKTFLKGFTGNDHYENRKKVYDLLSANGARIGSSYEEFMKKMQVAPAPAKSTPAKPKGTPITEAYRQKVLANVGNMMAETNASIQRTQNRMDYARANAGLRVPRVTIGDKNSGVRLGQNTKVVAKKPQYNPKSGKMEQTYITESGNEFTDRGAADLEQNTIDAYKDSMSVSGQLRDAYAERDRLDEAMKKRMKEIDERPNQRFNDFMRESAAAMTPGAGPAGELEARMSKYDNDDEYLQLMAAARKNHQTIQLLEDKKNNQMSSFWHSLGTTALNGYTFTDGMSEMRDATALTRASKHIDSINRKRAAGKPLTREEQTAEAVLKNFATDNAVQGMYGGDYGAWARAGGMTANSLDFMKDLMLNPGAGSMAKGIMRGTAKGMAKGLAKVTGKEAAQLWKNDVVRRTLKATGVLIGAHMAGAYVSNTTGIGRTAATMGTLASGKVGVDDNGNYTVENAMGLLPAFAEAERQQARENGSEMFGEFIPSVGGMVKKGLEKIGLSKLSGAMTNIGNKEWYKQYSRLLESGGYNGLPGEALEEYEGSLFDALTGHAGDAWDDMTNLQNHVDIWLGCATMGALLGSVPMMMQGHHTAQYYRYKHNTDKADNLASFRMTAERWVPLRDKIDNTDNSKMADVVTGIINNPDLHPEEKKAALNYVRNLTMMRGYNIAQVNNASDDEEQRPEVQSVNDNYSKGYDTTEPQAMNDAKNLLDMKREQVAKEHGIENVDEVDALIGDDPLRYIEEQKQLGNTDKLQSVIDYANAKSAYDGMVQRVQDDIDSRIEETNATVDSRVNRHDGMIHPASLKLQNEDGTDKKVYIVSGNVVMFDDGKGVDREKSDNTIVIRDVETGEMKVIPPDLIRGLDAAVNPEEEKARAREAIIEEMSQTAANNVDGVVSFNEGDTYTLTDENGEQTQVTLVANEQGLVDNGDGTVNVTVDGQNVVPMSMEDIQGGVDATNMARTVQAEQERQANGENVPNSDESVQNDGENVQETPDGVEYGVNDTFTFIDGEGATIHGEVQGISDDGVEIRTDEPLNGKRVQVIPAEEFENNVESINDADGNQVWAREYAEDAAATEEVSDSTEPLDHDLVAPATPTTEELVQMARGGNELAQHQLEAQGVEWEEPAKMQQTALSRVPINEETQEPMFEKADRETALDALNEVTGGNDENTTAIVRAQVEQATKALEALKKKEPTKKAPSLKGSPMAMVKAQQEAEANYNTAMEEYNAQVAAAEENLNAWSRINSLMNDRKRAIREQQEAERKVREEKLHAEAVARLEEDKRIAAEKAAEQEAVGTHAVNPKIKAKWDGSTKVEGNPNAITLADGSTIRGHYVLTEAGAATASHDVNNAYEPTEGFPVDENGESVNDRDYKRDKDAQRIVRDMADSYDSRALQTPVIVSKDGVVLSGNNRTMSGEIAAKNGTDKAYVDHLREFGAMFGFTSEQIDGMQHPRVVFVPDEELPYDASTFARFNAEQQKKQSNPEHAVKLGKIVPDNVFTSITNDISRFDRMSDYYADDKSVASAISQLLDAGVINEMQLPELRTGNALSAAGKELIENTLIGKVFQTSPDAVRQIFSTPTLRQSVVMGLNEIANNRTLAKSGYDLSKELAAAVDLVSRAKSDSPDIYKEGMPVSPYGRQQGLFDDEYGDSRVTDGVTLLLADLLNSGKPSDLRKVLSTYNNEAASSAAGQINMFSGDVTSKEEILKNVLKYFRNATPKEQQALIDAAVAERKRRAEAAEPAGGDEASEQATVVAGSDAEPQQPVVASEKPVKGNEPDADALAKEAEEKLSERITDTEDEWTEPSEYGEIYKHRMFVDGKEVIKVDAPDKSKNYPGTYYEIDGKQFGDLYEVANYIDGNEQPLSAKIEAASAEVNTDPTEAQKEAGNYKKGHVQVGTFDITIEQPQGSVRKGTDADGKQWESKMNNTYGYIRGAVGVDGDHIDVFLSNDIDGWNGRKVFVVDQYNPDGSFDEHKVMLGFNDQDEAKGDYLANYEQGWENGRRIDITGVNLEDFEKWIESSKRKTKPFGEYSSVKKDVVEINAPEEAGYSITPSTYTNKKGKTSDVSLLTFDHDLTADQERAVKEFAKERTGEGRFAPARGWKDRESGGWMFRSEEDARKAAEMVGNEQAVADNQPMTAQELRDAVEPKKPTASKKTASKKPANRVESVPTEEPIEPEKPKYEVSDEEMNGLMNDIRDILGIGDDEGDTGFKFRDPDELTAEQRQKLMSVGQRLAMAMVERGNESFGNYASMMVKALGDKVRPWLKAFYGGLEYVPGYDKYAITPYEEVKAFDVENFDKPNKDVMAQANMIVEEGKVQVAAEKANKELKATRNEQRKETEKQTAANTDAVAVEAESVASEATALAETSSDEQALAGAAERVDETLNKVNEQLALLGYYEADEVEKDYNEAYGYMRNAEKKAVKDAANLASQLIDDLGLDRFEATHREADKKGKRKTKPLAVANIAPAGGDVSMHLPLAEGRELYVNIQLVPSAGKGITNFGGDNLEVTGIMFRVNNPNGTGNDRYGRNEWVNNDVTYSELLDKVKREAYKYIPERTEVAGGKYATGDKVQYSTDGGSTWTDAIVVQPNDDGGYRIDTGLAPALWVNAHLDQLRHKPSESAEPKHEAVGDFYEDGINEDAVAALPADKPKPASKKNATKKVKPEQPVGDLFAGLFDNTSDNGLQGNDEAVRTETVPADNSGQQQGLRESQGSPRKTAAQEGGRPDGGRGGQSTGKDRAVSAGLHGLTEPKNTRNNHSERGADHAPTSVNGRIEANIKAIELAHELLESSETATPEQMSVLRQFSGWGGLGAAFSDGGYDWKQRERNKKIRELLGEEAYEQAVMSANSAYYTPAYVVDTLWDIANQLGFKGGNILEGSAGIGNILGQMPTMVSERSNIHAIEIDGTSGGILSLLYPDAKVQIQGFEQTRIPNGSVDLAITNVPFVTGLRVNDITGDSDLSKKFHNIHDFCIAKNVRKLREGGLGIFISSNGTLDNSKALRDWVVNEGGSDFIGAFRMNNKTFGGTTVTSDIIVIRKRVNGQKSAQAIDVSSISGERTAEYEEPGARKAKQLSMDYNKYFIEHPDHMAGEMRFAFEEGDTFRPTSKGLYPVSGKDQGKMLVDFVKSFTEEDNSQMTATDHHDVSLVLDASADGKKLGEMYMKDGKIVLASFGGYYPLEVNDKKIKGHTKQECFTAYAAIKTALADVMKYQTENEDNEGLKPLIAKLNKAYDSFVSTYGHFTKNNQLAWLRNDVDYPNVFSLETYKEQGDGKGGVVKTYDKADVMKGRVVEKEIEPHPENVKDGVVVSMFKNGRIDVPYIANQLGKSEAEVKREIIDSGLGFEDPTTRQMEVSYQYLSGNVREKLKQAEANNENGEYSKNIKALQDVVPMNIPAHLIDFTLGSSWIDPKLYDEYVKERTDIEVHFTAAGGTWFMKAPTYGVNVEKNRAMGIVSEMLKKTIMGHELIEAAIQNKSITVSRTEKHYNGTTETITDREAMAACAAKIDEIRQDFKDWARGKMQSDADLSARMEQEYNDRFNNYVPMSIPDDFVPEYFGGATHKFKMRPHQGKAIVRGTMQPLLLAHEVGTGKTFTLISTAMEMRRLGTARKPMIVVQNATVGQFAASAKELYPNAKVLVLDDNDRDAEGRKNFYAKIKYNDWDMVIIPQSTLDKIPDSDERQMQFVQDKIDEKMRVLEQMREADTNGKDPITRRAEKELADLQVEMAELSEEISKKRTANNEKKKAVAKQNAAVKAQEMLERSTDDVENFDDMGIDALLIDEAHEYKHLGFATAMQRGVKGVDPSYSKKSQGVYLKTQAILEKNNGRNVIFATGTPISNTAAEIWTFMRYLMPKDTMKEYGIYYFDDFVRNFGNIQQMPEFKTNGKFKEVNRFAGYVNLPELVRIWSSVSDTALTKDQTELVEKIPEMEGGKAQDIYLPQTRALRSVMKYVRKQLDDFEQMSGKEKKENSSIPLTMYGIAQRAAVDARLVQVDAEDDPRSKTNEAVRQTLRSLKETNDYKGTVAIFADSYENKHSGFNLYEDIKKKLVSQGVPESEIVVMKSGMKIKQKLDIFDKVNRGEVRVILGSTATLGTGVNIQERLHTLIHLDAPNRPMDYTQRNGRILRQGNLHKQWNKPVRVLRFGVEDSLDVTAYQRLKTKGAIADSVMEGDRLMQDSMNNRVLEEEEDVFGDTVAQLSGSEYALLKNNAEKNVRKYESRRKQWEADQVYIHYAKPRIEGQIEAAEQRAEEANAHLHAVQKAFPGGKFTEITVGKLKFASVDGMADFIKEHNKKILDVVKEMKKTPGTKTQTQTLTLSLGGYDFVVKTEMSRETVNNGGSLFAEIHRKMSYSCPELGLNDVPVKQSLLRNAVEDITENVITGRDFAERFDIATRMVQHDKSELEQVKQREGKPFEFEKELEEAKRQFEEYSEAMKVEMAEKEKKYAEMDASVDAATDVVADDEDEADDGNSKHRMLEDDTPNVMENDSNAMVDRVTELSERLHTPVRIIRTEEEVAALPSARQRRMKGSFNPLTGEVTIVVPNNANMADIENTFVHEVVGHDGLRVLFPDEAKLNNALDELYRVSNEGIQQTIDRMAQKMYDAEVDRIREKKRKEHEAKGEDANASYYADMAEAHAEASKKREQFKRDATEEYGADLAGRIGEKGFEQMSAEELTFWGKLKAMLQKALQKLLDGLKIPGRRKWGDKDWAFVLHEAYKRKKNGGKPTVFDAADTEVMRRKTGFGDTKFSDGKREQQTANERFNNELTRYQNGEMDKNEMLHLGRPQGVMRTFLPNLPIVMRQRVIKKGSEKKHEVDVSAIMNMPQHLSSPIFVFQRSEDTIGVLTDMRDRNGKNVCVAIELKRQIQQGAEYLEVNDVRSFHGREFKNIVEPIANNKTLKWVDKEKGLAYLSSASQPVQQEIDKQVLDTATKVVKDFVNPKVSDENVADEGIMFRDGDSVEYNKAMARDIYEQRVSRGMYQMQEALQDSMLGLKEAMDAILKAEGNGKTYIEDVAGYENAYLGENRLSSVNQAECTAFAQTLFKPMLEEVAKLAKTADERAELTDYMMAKHGLERNEVMARRAAEKDARSEFFAEVLAAQQAVDNDPLDQDAIDAFEDVKQRMQDREEELYLINRERDYAGLTALTGMDNVLDAETEAQQMVSDYERDHWVDGLWDKVNAVTKATLQKTYESGLINKATYDDISGMYENYIPLRGFDDKTSDEAYAYLTDKHSAFNAPIKTAKGRKSKADDPFANMEAMAESAIMQGNRNTLVKQKFLNFALNHPSNLVSVSDLWLWHNDVADEWQPINSGDLQGTERIEEDDSPAEVERKMRDFEYAMQQAAKNDPAHFRKQKDNPAIPYRVVESRDLRQHQVLVKRNGRDIILTINGNPRAAQALNGQTNPDNDVSGAIGAIMRLGETINRQLSAFYTTRNPDFVVSNFMRDMMYANTMVWVKESPNYAWRFHKNVAKVNPAKMKVLLAKLRNGTLDLNDETEKMFHLFMMNGGETGYANIRDIEQRKNDIKRELKKSNGQMPIRKAWDLLGERLDEYNRAVENCARFAAFMTSRQLGRTIDRSVYDAKEISVNFNKKGSGAKFWKTNGQTGIGNVAAFTSGLGRSFYVFWNAALQGSTNFGRQFKRHPKKAIAGAAAMFLLGALMASIGGGDGDDDKDDKDDYFNLPEYVRRSNVVFRLPGMDKSWISMPLPVEYRAMYGMGELMVSAMNGKEHYTAGELAHQMASQVSQMLPIDIMEGSGGFKAFVPSAIKPIAEVIGNESWTGMPIYKDTPFNKDMPEWTKAYKSANKYLVGLSKALNEATGGDAYTSGKIDINPAQVEYLLNGIFGGVSSTIDRLTKMGETVIGDREYDPRSFLLLNRLVKNGDERTEYRAVNNEYFRIKEESEKLRTRLNHYENDTADGVFDYAEKIAWLNNSPEYRILETYEDYSGDIDDINEELKAAASDEERKGLEAELNEKKKELVDAVNNIRNGKQQ
jgi:N12 class adenine-specific DNA methylase